MEERQNHHLNHHQPFSPLLDIDLSQITYFTKFSACRLYFQRDRLFMKNSDK